MSRTIIPSFSLAADNFRTFYRNVGDLLSLAGFPFNAANVHAFLMTIPEPGDVGASWVGTFSQIVFNRAKSRADISLHIRYFSFYLWQQPRQERAVLEQALRELAEEEEAA